MQEILPRLDADSHVKKGVQGSDRGRSKGIQQMQGTGRHGGVGMNGGKGDGQLK